MATTVSRVYQLQPTSTDESIASNFCHPMRMTSTSSSINRPIEMCVFLKSGPAYELSLENGGLVTAAMLQDMMLQSLDLPEIANEVFYIWLISPLLKLQLKSHHVPLKLCRQWHDLLQKFTSATNEQIAADEPCVFFQRNAFYPKQKELQITDDKILRLLFHEGKENVLEGLFGCDEDEYEYLAGILAYIEHGKFDLKIHTPLFIRMSSENLLPLSLCKKKIPRRASRSSYRAPKSFEVETRVMNHWKKVSKIVKCKADCYKSFLEFLWKMPIYGSVYFTGEIEPPNAGKGITGSSYKHVYVGINREGVFLVDLRKQELLLGLLYDDLSWEYTEQNHQDMNSLPCIWLEFDSLEDGKKVSKLLQIYSKQASMMNGMINACIEELNIQDKEYLNVQQTEHVDSSDLGVVEGPCTGIDRLNDKDFKEIPLDDEEGEEIEGEDCGPVEAAINKVLLTSAPGCIERPEHDCLERVACGLDASTISRTRAATVQARTPNRLGLDTVDGSSGLSRANTLDGRNRAYMTLPARTPKTTLCKKMDKLTLSTFSEEGDLIPRKPKLNRPFSMSGMFK